MNRVKAIRYKVLISLISLIGLIGIALPNARAQTDATNAASATTAPPFVADTPTSAPVTSQVPMPAGSGGGGQQDDIADIRPPFFFLHSWFWLWMALAAAALVALLVFVWKWLSRSPYLSPKSAYDLTLEKLEQARALLSEENPVPYAVFVSETIRSYLGQRFQTPSTRRTTEEFLRLMQADSGTPLAEHSELLKNFLQACDLVKFARYQPTLAELEQVQQRAFTFVHATKPAPVEAPANGRKP
jgi:hypothetical protein